MDLALNNLQRLICHKTQTTNQPFNIFSFQVSLKVLATEINLGQKD